MVVIIDNQLVEPEIDRILTQYRESPQLIHLLRTYLRQVEMIAQAIVDMPSFFDIDSAVGDQLTLIGKRMGWPRCHCVCFTQPVFGFDCGNNTRPIAGFCDSNGTWDGCGDTGVSEICINDDELYRKFLKVRSYQMRAQFDYFSLNDAVQIFFGPQAGLLDAGHGRVVVTPGRPLTYAEQQVQSLYPRVLPTAPGIRVRFHFDVYRVFGFGEGWGGFCEPFSDGEPLITENGVEIETENGISIDTGPLTAGAIWMCETDVHPYTCP